MQLALVLTHLLHEISFSLLQLLALLIDNFHLGIKDEFLTFDIKAVFGQILETAVKIALHLSILGL